MKIRKKSRIIRIATESGSHKELSYERRKRTLRLWKCVWDWKCSKGSEADVVGGVNWFGWIQCVWVTSCIEFNENALLENRYFLKSYPRYPKREKCSMTMVFVRCTSSTYWNRMKMEFGTFNRRFTATTQIAQLLTLNGEKHPVPVCVPCQLFSHQRKCNIHWRSTWTEEQLNMMINHSAMRWHISPKSKLEISAHWTVLRFAREFWQPNCKVARDRGMSMRFTRGFQIKMNSAPMKFTQINCVSFA